MISFFVSPQYKQQFASQQKGRLMVDVVIEKGISCNVKTFLEKKTFDHFSNDFILPLGAFQRNFDVHEYDSFGPNILNSLNSIG